MIDIIKDTLIDAIKLLPFLFIVFLIMEYIEHKLNNKNKNIIKKAGKFGPLLGGILGAFPQCGFSAAATNLYATRIISLGTLISIYLSTSDELIPILISEGSNVKIIITIILMKVVIGIIMGFIIDFIYRSKAKEKIKDFCKEEDCDCDHGILRSTIKHTINITLFIMFISFFINSLVYFIGEESIGRIFLKDTIFGPFITSLIGLIPNCASSVAITELYLSNSITLGSVISGLLTGSGVAYIILFKMNKDLKENINILLMMYGIGVMFGIVIDIFKITL